MKCVIDARFFCFQLLYSPHAISVSCLYVPQPIPGSTVTEDMVLKLKKSMNDLYLEQQARFPLEMVDFLPPKNAELAPIFAGLSRAKAAVFKDNFEDPGVHHAHRQRLTEQQAEDVSMFGLLDKAKGWPRNSLVIEPEFHFTATAGLVAFLRSDSALSIMLTNLFVMNAPPWESGGASCTKCSACAWGAYVPF